MGEMGGTEEDRVLLDYYTRKMFIHAMIIVALFLVHFQILIIISQFPVFMTYLAYWATKFGLTFGYIILTFFGMFEIRRYKHFAGLARQKAGKFQTDEEIEEKGMITKFMKWVFQNAETLFGLIMLFFLITVWIQFGVLIRSPR